MARFIGLYFCTPSNGEEEMSIGLFMCDPCIDHLVDEFETDNAELRVDGVVWPYQFHARIND